VAGAKRESSKWKGGRGVTEASPLRQKRLTDKKINSKGGIGSKGAEEKPSAQRRKGGNTVLLYSVFGSCAGETDPHRKNRAGSKKLSVQMAFWFFGEKQPFNCVSAKLKGRGREEKKKGMEGVVPHLLLSKKKQLGVLSKKRDGHRRKKQGGRSGHVRAVDMACFNPVWGWGGKTFQEKDENGPKESKQGKAGSEKSDG